MVTRMRGHDGVHSPQAGPAAGECREKLGSPPGLRVGACLHTFETCEAQLGPGQEPGLRSVAD